MKRWSIELLHIQYCMKQSCCFAIFSRFKGPHRHIDCPIKRQVVVRSTILWDLQLSIELHSTCIHKTIGLAIYAQFEWHPERMVRISQLECCVSGFLAEIVSVLTQFAQSQSDRASHLKTNGRTPKSFCANCQGAVIVRC
mgnify:CR=1 FL=1